MPTSTQPPEPGQAHSGGATSQTSLGRGEACGVPGILDLPCLHRSAGVAADNILTCGDAYYVGMFAQIGAYRAIAALVARFLDGLNLSSDELRSKLCAYIKHKPLRLACEDRYRGVLSLSRDATLERLLVGLSNAMIELDLARGPRSITTSRGSLPEPAARIAVLTAIEALLLFLDEKGGGGGVLVTHEAATELLEIFAILAEPELRCHVQGDDVDDIIAVIAGLLANETDRPNEWEAHQMTRKACFGRKIFQAIAPTTSPAVMTQKPETPALTELSDHDLETLAVLVYEWRAAHGPMYDEAVEDAGEDDEAADENRLQVIRLRRRAS